ncbi:hypothetical protein N7510_008133 [Penicillium lagena]|uniref:uncharacterized protein n=1 Tax=Penicillium lagena TaxID=94218 RepID=UPI00254109E5|nr:uncharacterized protein N7510_008133 [Penicillium lagena]KAJ5611414.1 hypothetical protein N7510_008133 [Penicillium lagena]
MRHFPIRRRSVHYVSFGQNPDYYAEWCNGKFHCKATQAIKVLVHQCRQEGDIDQLALGMENTCVVVKGSELGKSKAKWYLGEHYETLDRVLEKNHRGIVVRYPSSSPLLGNFNSGGRSLGDFLNLKAWDEYIMIRESSTLGWSCEASRSWAAYQMTRFVHWKHGERSMGSLKDGSGVTLLFTLQSKFDCSSGMG